MSETLVYAAQAKFVRLFRGSLLEIEARDVAEGHTSCTCHGVLLFTLQSLLRAQDLYHMVSVPAGELLG